MAVDGPSAAWVWSLAAALALLLALRLAAALLPLWAVARMRSWAGQRRLLLLASRFAGGVLLATALLHMLPEAREQLPGDAWGGCLAELLVGSGFLAIYLLEELWHSRAPTPAAGTPPEAPPLAPLQLPALTGVQQQKAAAAPGTPACPWPPASRIAPADSTQHLLAVHGADGDGHAGCTWALLVGLGVHSLLEGVALGLQPTPRDTWLLLVALSAHAIPLLLCVGAKVAASPVRRWSAAARLSLLAAAAPVGGVLGAAAGVAALGRVAGAMQALAAGSLLYAALAEGLAVAGGHAHPHPHPHPKQEARSPPAAALALLGFALIAALQLTVVHHHHPDGDEVLGNMTSQNGSYEMEGHVHL